MKEDRHEDSSYMTKTVPALFAGCTYNGVEYSTGNLITSECSVLQCTAQGLLPTILTADHCESTFSVFVYSDKQNYMRPIKIIVHMNRCSDLFPVIWRVENYVIEKNGSLYEVIT